MDAVGHKTPTFMFDYPVECHGPTVVDLRQKDRDVYDWQVKCELPYASVDDTSN